MGGFLRRYWLGMLAILILAASVSLALFAPQFVDELDVRVDLLGAALGWGAFLVQYLYSKSEWFYTRVNQLRLLVTNETTQWNFVVELADCQQENPLDRIWDIAKQVEEQPVAWEHSSQLIVNFAGFTLRAFIPVSRQPVEDDGNGGQLVAIQLSNLELPYRRFRQKIENQAIPLIGDIVKDLQPKQEKYAVKIGFGSNNPFFGLFVRRLELPSVVSFTCDLIETTVGKHRQMVAVRKDRIEIVTDNLTALQTLSQKYVRLAASPS